MTLGAHSVLLSSLCAVIIEINRFGIGNSPLRQSYSRGVKVSMLSAPQTSHRVHSPRALGHWLSVASLIRNDHPEAYGVRSISK